MRQKHIFLDITVVLFGVIACSLFQARTPTPQTIPTVTPIPTSTTVVIISPTFTPLVASATLTSVPPSATRTVTFTSTNSPGTPSGPYAVILVEENDVLNIRSQSGANYPVVGSFSATATDVQSTGPASMVGDALWVEVNNPSGGKGWVNAYYLTEYVSSANFCADARVTTLLQDFKLAMNDSNGDLFANLVNPNHGLDVHYWGYGPVVNYLPSEAAWVFSSTFQVNWGSGPSALDDVGTFSQYPLTKLLEVLNDPSYMQYCDDASKAGAVMQPWPFNYTNINFYALYKPGSPGVDLDYGIWLAGVEYVGGKPYLFSLIRFQWEP